MILSMARVRILGPRDRLPLVLRVLQELSVLHLIPPAATDEIHTAPLSTREERERRQLLRLLEDLDATLTTLGPWLPAPVRSAGSEPEIGELARWARLARRTRRTTDRLLTQSQRLEEERALLLKYQGFFTAFRPLLESESRWRNASVYHVILKRSEQSVIPRLRAGLTSLIGDAFELYHRDLPGGDTALLVVVSAGASARVDRTLAEAIPTMIARLGALPNEISAVTRELKELARSTGLELRRAEQGVSRRLQALNAVPFSGVTPRAFVLEGWLPARSRQPVIDRLRQEAGESVVVSEVSREEWRSEEAPVVLQNPRLFRPFEAILSLMPLPRYGTIDPTPFVALFFPAFFGLMLGDVGYGVLLGIGGLILHRRSRPGTMLRSVAEILGPCSLMTILAGFLFGELFGDLGRRVIGLRPLAFDREEALIPFLLLSVSIGAVHILLGLILGVVNARRHPREAIGKGAAAAGTILIIVALLAAVDVLPRGFFTPSVIGLLIAFPLMILAEGVVAPIEFLSTLGNILSYARIMALGVASVMLAVVANRMVGMLGSAVVGILFALLFHLVNFAIGLFSPTIHALRLHYVEFFGKFYSPGGVRYQPFGGWTRATGTSHP